MKFMQALHTIRHLRRQQIVGQLAQRARRIWDNPQRVLGWHTPAFPGCVWNPAKQFLPPLQSQPVENVQAGRMAFLHQSIDIGYPPQWNRPDLSKLWQFNLQYFDYLWALDFASAASIVTHWIEHHAPARNRVGWEPYPVSLRLVNWCGVFFDKFRKQVEANAGLRDRLWASIFRQAQWLDSHLETHLMGNHLLENAIALTVVGSCFGGEDAARWYQRGLSLLREQLAEQMLADGGHFERSPMYHSRVVYTLLVLQNIDRQDLKQIVQQPLSRSIEALKVMCHPDGWIALFNDSALGIYNEPAELSSYAGADGTLPVGPFSLPDSGYFGARTADGSYIICDAGAIGPDHQPGHAHGDMLSFELSLRGQRVIVDSGVYEYPAGEMREYCRSTRAHNTVEIDSQDQCEFWGSFRVARRGSVRDVNWTMQPDGFELSAAHDGYARLHGHPIHQRTFRWFDSGRLEAKDVITSAAAHRFVSRIHLHPDCRIERMGSHEVLVQHPRGAIRIAHSGSENLKVEDSFYCPEFGQRLRNAAIAFEGPATAGRTEFSFSIEQRA